MSERKPLTHMQALLYPLAIVGCYWLAFEYDPMATPSEYNDGTVTLDLAQWQCRQAETVLTLVDEKLTPVGQCTRYERIISED